MLIQPTTLNTLVYYEGKPVSCIKKLNLRFDTNLYRVYADYISKDIDGVEKSFSAVVEGVEVTDTKLNIRISNLQEGS